MDTSSKKMHDDIKLKSSETELTMSKFSRSQSNKAPLSNGGVRDFHQGCEAASLRCNYVNMEQNLREIFQTCSSVPQKNQDVSEAKRESDLFTSRVPV